MTGSVDIGSMGEAARWIAGPAQLIALGFMAAVYAVKIALALRRTPMRDRAPARGSEAGGAIYALATLAMPWELDSLRRRPLRYAEFVMLHVGVATAIAASFVLPYAPSILSSRIAAIAAQCAIGIGLLAALVRLGRRALVPHVRAITSIGDVVPLVALISWLGSAIWAVAAGSEAGVLTFMSLTAILIVYVPFSKISHYVLWPFVRVAMGSHFGRRGVYPVRRGRPHGR